MSRKVFQIANADQKHIAKQEKNSFSHVNYCGPPS